MSAVLAAAVVLLDLGAAGEPVGQHHGVVGFAAQPRQQRLFGQRAADLAVAGGEPEVPGQSAAAGVQVLDVDAGLLQQLAGRRPSRGRRAGGSAPARPPSSGVRRWWRPPSVVSSRRCARSAALRGSRCARRAVRRPGRRPAGRRRRSGTRPCSWVRGLRPARRRGRAAPARPRCVSGPVWRWRAARWRSRSVRSTVARSGS